MSIRLRLALLFTTLIAIIGLVWCVGLIGGLRLTLDRIHETAVQNKVHEIEDYLRGMEAQERRVGRTLSLTSFDALPPAFSDDGTYLQLTDLDGTPLNRSPNLGTNRLPMPTSTGVTEIDLAVPRLAAAPHALMASRSIELPGRGKVGWVQAALPLSSQEQTITQFTTIAAGSWLIFVSLAFLAAYLFTGRALAPVVAMTEDVRRMSSNDLHLRLSVNHPPRDEIERLAATFNDLFERLETAFAAKRQFVADASHELKSPLTAIMGNLRLIRARGPSHPDSVPGWVASAEREAERLARLVESLLVLAKAGEGQLTLDRRPVDLSAVAREVTAEFQGIAPRISYRGGEAVWVRGDRDRLKQVVINLVDNALRATRDGGEVWIETAREGEVARLTVEDTGVGMPPEVVSRIFDRFFRVDSARDRAQGGTGLGLAITESLVQSHEGSIRVDSAPGRGTRFDVELPASSAA